MYIITERNGEAVTLIGVTLDELISKALVVGNSKRESFAGEFTAIEDAMKAFESMFRKTVYNQPKSEYRLLNREDIGMLYTFYLANGTFYISSATRVVNGSKEVRFNKREGLLSINTTLEENHLVTVKVKNMENKLAVYNQLNLSNNELSEVIYELATESFKGYSIIREFNC